MKKAVTLYLFILFLGLTHCKGQTYTRIISLVSELDEKGEIKGKADTLAIEYLDTNGNVFKKVATRHTGDRVFIKTTLYNPKGKIIGYVSNYNNSIISKDDLTRDTNGFIVMSKMYELNSKDTLYFDFLNFYDNASLVLQSRMINRMDSSVVGKYLTRYDQNKNIVEDIEVDSLDKELTKNVYEYSKTNQLLKQSYFKKGTLISFTNYFYEGKKKLEAIQIRLPDSSKVKLLFVYE
jgi:hypothetical protein